MRTKFNTDWAELRNFCVKYNFYTKGTNQEYSDMFNLFNMIGAAESFEEMTKTLEKTARDILDHSTKDSYIICGGYENNVKEIMSILIEIGAVSIYFD